MKSRIKKFITLLPVLLLMIILIPCSAVKADAKVQDGTYNFSSCDTAKFQIKNNKLTLKVDKSSSGITIGDKKLYKLNVKVAKNCKYSYEGYSRSSLDSDPEKRSLTYSELKEMIKSDRDNYIKYGYASNLAESFLKIKNGKVVKVVYCVLF